ncbi:MAG: hypothetical protein G01um10148_89 [Parcubacteria group bacterium Gr01-1014_8]|nr:MAG: hypothetical protein G01um10148_89 [Parcubacteria group bacterium Gr01-1014_8]
MIRPLQMVKRAKDATVDAVTKAAEVIGETKTWQRIKNQDAPGVRWIAGMRVESLGKKIGNSQLEADAIGAQINGINEKGGDAASIVELTRRRNAHIDRITKLGGRRRDVAGVMDRKYGEKLKEPLEMGTQREKIKASREERGTLDTKLTEQRAKFVKFQARYDALVQKRDYANPDIRRQIVEGMAILADEMNITEKNIRDVDTILDSTSARIDKWDARHGSAARWAKRNGEIAKNGLFDTSAAERKAEAPKPGAAAGSKGGEVVNLKDARRRKGGRGPDGTRVTPQKEAGERGDQYYKEIAELLGRENTDIEASLKELMQVRFKNASFVTEPFGRDNLIDAWNRINEDSPKNKIGDKGKKIFGANNDTELTLVEFGKKLHELYDVNFQDVISGITDMGVAEEKEAFKEKQKAA